MFLLRGDDGGVPSARAYGGLLVVWSGFPVVLRVRSLEVPASSVVYGRVRCAFMMLSACLSASLTSSGCSSFHFANGFELDGAASLPVT